MNAAMVPASEGPVGSFQGETDWQIPAKWGGRVLAQQVNGNNGNRLWAERLVERSQGLLLEIEISDFMVHEADEQHASVDLLEAELLAGQEG